jgi:hypothetical protein
VVSSDESGNFYKEIYLQDDASLPSQGIKVVVEQMGVQNNCFNFLITKSFITTRRAYVVQTAIKCIVFN